MGLRGGLGWVGLGLYIRLLELLKLRLKIVLCRLRIGSRLTCEKCLEMLYMTPF